MVVPTGERAANFGDYLSHSVKGEDAAESWLRGTAVLVAGGCAGMLQQYVSYGFDLCSGASRVPVAAVLRGPGLRELWPAAFPAAVGFLAFEFGSELVAGDEGKGPPEQ